MSKRSPRTGLKAALASAGVVALMSTGAAFAASGHAPWSGAASGRPTTISSHSHPTDDPSETAESDDPSAPDSQGTTGPNAHAYPGLCRAYTAGQKSDHGDALSSPAFAALVTAAGGSDAVPGFCASLTPGSGHATHPARPSHPVVPTHTTPTHPAPTHTVPTHPDGTSHPSAPATQPSHGSHPSRP